MHHSMNQCGSAANKFQKPTGSCTAQSAPAALPPHSAVRLCLTANSPKMSGGYASQLRHSLKRRRASVGKAKPFRTVRRQSRRRRLSDTTSNQTQSGAETSFNAPLHERVWKDSLPLRWGHSITHCGFAAAQCGKALPYRQLSKNDWRLRLPSEAQPQKKKEERRKGAAFPHCAAAQPHWFIEWRLGRVGLRKVKCFPDWR